MGDAFPRLDPPHFTKHDEMERGRPLLSPVFEEQNGRQTAPDAPTAPALLVTVDIRFTDPVIRSRYFRTYASSPGFDANNRICRGLVRRIERCSEELLTRKDSAALETMKSGTYEAKPQRFQISFRIVRRETGEWAARTYRSYQKHPLTIGLTREIMLAIHRMIGLFLRRHDEGFKWLETPVSEVDSEGSETMVPSRDGPLSLLAVPRSRFIEATQTFEFVPGYTIDLIFRSRNPHRKVHAVDRKLKINSTQATPLTHFLSEDITWKAVQAINQGLDTRKRELDDHIRDRHGRDEHVSHHDTLEIDFRISNNLGPLYSHMHRNIRSKLALFRDVEARDCDHFLNDIENQLVHIRNEADGRLNALNDLEFRIVELKGVGWTLHEPATFTLDASASYSRRTIQAALERIQTGIGDVIRGHNLAIRITAQKRGHLVLDKAIVAHEKRGKPREVFSSTEDAQTAFVSRLKVQIQQDIDKVFEDSCSINDIPDDEEGYFIRPTTPAQPEQPYPEEPPSPSHSPASTRSSPARQPRTLPLGTQGSQGVAAATESIVFSVPPVYRIYAVD
ncbi:hypothetical protein N0V88_004124 [Collariella sp. IMI 366227]|nr:hypothetical protein N0V88_004124 [Collariella sp. IMI 366227]